jgi:hypothetical protein
MAALACRQPAGPGRDTAETLPLTSHPTDSAPPGSSRPEDSSVPTQTAGVPPIFEAPFLWDALVLEGAQDLGFVPGDEPTPVAPGPVTFAEVGFPAGLGFGANGGNLHGVGLAFVDVDADGLDDLLVINGVSPTTTYDSVLWHNLGGGGFEDATASSGISAVLAGKDGYSVAAGDLDADGDVDLYVGAHPNDVLLLNAGDGTFTDGTVAFGAGGPASAAGLADAKIVGLGDYDGDGLLDVLSASSTFVSPGPNGYVLHGGGAAGFTDTTTATGFFAPPEGTPCAVMWSDFDADGRSDAAIWNDIGDPTANRVLLHSDGVGFTDVHALKGWTNAISSPMGIDSVDLDRDGFADWFVGNSGPSLLLLSLNGGWIDAAEAAGIATTNAWGLGFEDFDSDRWWDLFVGQSGSDPHLVLTNSGVVPPLFTTTEVTHQYLFPGNLPVAFADYDRDGDTDVATVGVSGQRVELFRNDTDRGTAHWLQVRVDAAPGDGARGGVTARVVVGVGDVVLWRDITGGSSRSSQNALYARFGLGQRTGADWVGVLWPDGRQVAATGIPGDSTLVVNGDLLTY